jgi:hypothetical protein
MLSAVWFCCDLHVHSDRSSDCRVAPDRVVQAAARRGVRLLAITDHHDLSAFRPARTAARSLDVTVIPGVELTCPAGRSGVHVLGLFGPRLDIPAATAALELEAAGFGRADGYVPYDVVEAVSRIHALGGLAIAAHARASKGLLEECRGQALDWVLANARFDAVEVAECRDPHRIIRLPRGLQGVPVISGSDAHDVEDNVSEGHPFGVGSRPCWAVASPANFNGLRFALSDPPGVDATALLDGLRGRARIDQLLTMGDHRLRAVIDDASRHHQAILDAAVELLNGDGGFLLVGVRRRFQGATRGASLQLTLGELHDLVVNAIQPSPIVRLRQHRTTNGLIHELQFVATENPARRYELRPREAATRAARADRAALEALGALDVKAMTATLRRRAGEGKPLPVGELARLWPYRDWFASDRELRDLVGESLAAYLIEAERPPRWLRLWAAEHPRARHHFRTAYRALVRRDATREHRERLRQALEESVRAGRLQPGQRRSVEQWFERTQADLLAGEPALQPPTGDMGALRERARRVFGQAIISELDTEAQRAEAQYRAAMQEAFGAQSSVVLDVQQTDAGEQRLTVGDLEGLGIDKVIVSGSGAGTGTLVVVPDHLSMLRAPDLLRLWAQPEPQSAERVPAVVRRCVESGKHLPVLRFAGGLDRDGVEALMEELADVGAAQQRNAILRDLALLLEPPAEQEDDADARAVVGELDDKLALDPLKAAANAALAEPDVAREVLNENPAVAAAVRRAAQPGEKLTIRRPAIVLAGALGDRGLLADWQDETNPAIRLSLVEGIMLLGEDQEVDAVLFEALASNAGLVERAARALAARGEAGYDALLARLPAGDTERRYLVSGVVPVADRDPDRARLLVYRACESASGQVLEPVRRMDRQLYLRDAQTRFQ